jgi:hypothetical protein
VKSLQHWLRDHDSPPKIPGLTSWLRYGDDGLGGARGSVSFPSDDLNQLINLGTPDNRNYADDGSQTLFSLGADCSGYVGEAMNYAGNSYALRPIPKLGTQDFKNEYVIASPTIDWPTNPTGLQYLVPGDILYYGPNHHVAIVSNVTGHATAITRANVEIIQATSGKDKTAAIFTPTYAVEIHDFWQSLSNPDKSDFWYPMPAPKDFAAMRLRTNP